ncbi:MAG: preprotein translocase subunit SecE [Candidatus Uhrbacteria bacterium]|nr:preprotein translocase subunit SecE [Candidatus Uhrbacteria bacterium]
MANPVNDFITYVRSSIAELKKVTWPTKQQTIRYSAMVVAVSVGVAIFFGALDFGFSRLVTYTLSTRQATPVENVTPENVVPTLEPEVTEVKTETPAENTDIKLPLE